MKTKICPRCNEKVPTNNKGKLKPHIRWDWPGYPDYTQARSSNMYETLCEQE